MPRYFHFCQNLLIALASSAWELKERPSRAVRKQLSVISRHGSVTATMTVETFQMREAVCMDLWIF